MDQDLRTQLIAVALVSLAAITIGVGEHFNWIHLTDFGNLFGGAGVGILTGQKLQQQSTRTGDIVNPPQTGATS